MQTIFDLCQPRKDVLDGQLRDEDFAADLSKVVNGSAPPEYRDPALFFSYSHPTRGLKTLLDSVCRRLSGAGGELNSILRLDTQYGGGKTHSLIALVHAVRGMKGVAGASEFVDPKLLPTGPVRIAALDGENADPTNGLRLEDGVLARTLWGEMAWRLAGRAGFERVRQSDERHVAPGTETIVELFGGEPTLILIDEISVYLRKVAKSDPEAAGQFPAFLQALVKAVAASPRACLVTTLAVETKSGAASDAYRDEHQRAVLAFEEAESILARKVLNLDPTEADETVDVLRRRLFETVNRQAGATIARAYADVWQRNAASLPPVSSELREQFEKGYPFHPETMNVLMLKVASLQTFQRTRGMLRVLARTVRHLWETRPPDVFAIHPHHIDPGFSPIRQELITKLGQQAYVPALNSDVASVPGSDPSTAQVLDATHFPGAAPVTSYVARTVFLNTLAFGDAAQGIPADHLRLSVCSPTLEPSFVESARKSFVQESLFLDDRPGAPMRLRIEPNLTQVIQKAMKEIDPDEVRGELNARVRELFEARQGDFHLVPFPAGPYEIPDDVGDGRPYLVVLAYDAFHVMEGGDLPADLVRMATRAGSRDEYRRLLNNFVFLIADERMRADMRNAVRRRLALQAIQASPRFADLPDYQQRKVREEVEKSRTTVAVSVLQCYRHLYYPKDGGSQLTAKLARTTVDLPGASESPGNGQGYVKRTLRDQRKLLAAGDNPDAPTFVRDNTPLRTKGHLSTRELRDEYRRAPNLSILLGDNPLVDCVRLGIQSGKFVLRVGAQIWGKGDPDPAVRIDDESFVHTLEDAESRGLWPRKPPEVVAAPTAAAGGKNTSAVAASTTAAASTSASTTSTRPDVFDSEGPLRQALGELFGKARKAKCPAIQSLTVRLFEDRGAWAFLGSVTSLRGVDVQTTMSVSLADEGIAKCSFEFQGTLAKATVVKSLLERLLQSAPDKKVEIGFVLTFQPPSPTTDTAADALIAQLTKHGSAEAYVEAEAAPGKVG